MAIKTFPALTFHLVNPSSVWLTQTVIVSTHFLKSSISCLENPSKMSPHDTLHFLKTFVNLWRFMEGPVISAGDSKGPKPGEIWRLLTSIQQPPMRQINAYLFASKITPPFRIICPWVRNSLSLSALTLRIICNWALKSSSFALFQSLLETSSSQRAGKNV